MQSRLDRSRRVSSGGHFALKRVLSGICDTREVEGIDAAFLNPTAGQKAQWFEEMPNLTTLTLGL